jgi:hypothetical protein
MTDSSWNDALDALESLIDRQRAFLAGTGPMPDSPWDPPPTSLPDGLRVRALTLAAACDEIETALRARLHSRPSAVASPYR